MKKSSFLIIIIFFFAFQLQRINSDEIPRLGIKGEDDRVLLSTDGSAWDAIGQVNISGYRRITRCTGTLVAADRVITAAHCLIDQKTGQNWPLDRIHFVAGVRGEQNKGHATAKCLRFMKDPHMWPEIAKGKFAIKDFEDDAAVIILSHTLEVQPAFLAENFLEREDQPLLHIAYPAERRFIPSAHIHCHLIRKEPNSVIWSTDCDSSPASSGGPLFLTNQNEFQLAAIMVGAGRYNYALPFSAWRHLILESSCP